MAINVNPLSGVIANSANNLIQRTNARVQSTINTLLNGNTQDVASLSVAAQLQNNIGTIREAAKNVAQGISLVQVADQGVASQQDIVDRLTTIAAQANNGTINSDTRESLNAEFKNLVKQLDTNVAGTKFSGQQLLDGEFAISLDTTLGDTQGDGGGTLEIPDLSAKALGADKLDVLSQENASAALDRLASIGNTLNGVRASTGAFSQSLNFAAANLETVFINEEAARSTLEDSDFAEASTALSLANLQYQAAIAAAVQGKNLPQSFVKQLIG